MEKPAGHFGQAKDIVKFTVGEKSSIRRDLGAMEFKF